MTPVKAQPKPYEPGCKAPDNSGDSDLCSQWGAVRVAEQANRISAANLWLAFVTLTLTLIGTGALIWTLAETRAVSRRELRAYLFVDAAGIADGTHHPERDPNLLGRVGSALIIKNSGQTPAHNVIHYSLVDIAPFSEEERMSAPLVMEQNFKATLPPGGTNSADRMMDRVPTQEEIDSIKKGESAAWVYGAISYEDVFGVSHRTNYRLYFCGSWPPPNNVILRNAQKGNEAT